MVSQPNTDNAAAVATSDDSAPARLNGAVLGALLPGGSLAGVSPVVVESGVSSPALGEAVAVDFLS